MFTTLFRSIQKFPRVSPRQLFEIKRVHLQVLSVSPNSKIKFSTKSQCKIEERKAQPDDGKQTEKSREDTKDEQVKGSDQDEPAARPSHQPLTRRAKSGFGSKLKRSRHSDSHGLPPIVLPEWFLQRNIHIKWDNKTQKPIEKTRIDKDSVHHKNTDVQENLNLTTIEENYHSPDEPYALNQSVYTEVLTTLKAGLDLKPPKNNSTRAALRPISVLQCPKDGASLYLDQIVLKVSSDLGADLIQLDAEDFAQIVGSYLNENLAWNYASTSLYGYNAQKVAGNLESYDDLKNSDQESQHGFHGPEENMTSVTGNIGNTPLAGDEFSKLLHVFVQKPRDNLKSVSWLNNESINNSRTLDLGSEDRSKDASQVTWNDLKANAILKALVEAADHKRTSFQAQSSMQTVAEDSQIEETKVEISSNSASEGSEHYQHETEYQPLIIQIKDYQELRSIDGGSELLQKLYKIVNQKWQRGRKIICIGTTEGLEAVHDKRSIQMLQEDTVGSDRRTILIPPGVKNEQSLQFKSDNKSRIRRINIRHLEDMILKLCEGSEGPLIIDLEKKLSPITVASSGLEDNVWTYGRVHRISSTIVGVLSLSSTISLNIDGIILSEALNILARSDEAKFAWGLKESKDCEALAARDIKENKPLKFACNTYEKKLLNGVIAPEKIRTSFSNIRVSKETIEALQSMTSLSLSRPEAFTYGILRRDKIHGVLLYGPPGTGKTLLAKAVAKECGATVLEVTAADLNNMYVGEGEKNVKAVFTLAKKLSPCVIFIDEADSMFGSREGSRQKTSHREMINQFLREWNEINEFTGFIMVATNRPYDLDDAILRRLPRRILVDLPDEQDRVEILKIHLQDEVLADSVCLAALARETPYYSGSDLNNLAVAAALACVREESLTVDKPANSTPRILEKRHFDQALGEISASIDEDMHSLVAIKKFDEKYGDRKGRRKKGPGLGFGSSILVERDSNAARVRPPPSLT
ncbi:unnamed protein product [Blumeria hordei]|uniref:AAA+ ATPase domain-containing protein n=1 Tax=Blumeria hordei TaxID=2867405 RepID=A0A383URD4_BLUHO|nr:unnamed protein product [Blumeria hordei]